MKEDVLNPVIPVKVRGETVDVRELTWKDYLRAVKDLTGTILKLMGEGGTTLVLNREKILEAITAQEDLVGWVIEKSTGKDQAFINSLSARELLPLLIAVVDLNLSEEVIGPGKELAGRMGAALGLKTASPESLTTSSAPATKAATSTK
jgi:hypothetical protein